MGRRRGRGRTSRARARMTRASPWRSWAWRTGRSAPLRLAQLPQHEPRVGPEIPPVLDDFFYQQGLLPTSGLPGPREGEKRSGGVAPREHGAGVHTVRAPVAVPEGMDVEEGEDHGGRVQFHFDVGALHEGEQRFRLLGKIRRSHRFLFRRNDRRLRGTDVLDEGRARPETGFCRFAVDGMLPEIRRGGRGPACSACQSATTIRPDVCNNFIA